MDIADVHSAGEYRHNCPALDGGFGGAPEITLDRSIDDPAVLKSNRAGLSGLFGIGTNVNESAAVGECRLRFLYAGGPAGFHQLA